MRSAYLGGQHSWVPTEKCEIEVLIMKEAASPFIKCTQFLLTLAWTSTVHKVQILSLEQVVFDFDLQKEKSFEPGQMYTRLRSVKTYVLII